MIWDVEILSEINLPQKSTIEKLLVNNQEALKQALRDNPALLEYVYSDAEIQRKYIKLTPEIESKLKKYSEKSGLAEGILLGLGAALLLYLVFKD